MKKLSYLFIALITCSIYAQVKFEPGFIVDKSGNKTECLIRNLDWSNNPESLTYKLDENADVLIASVGQITAFQIGNNIRYVSSTVNVDKSSTQISNLSSNPEPEFEERTVFLKQLVSGSASLFMYSDNGKRLFYYTTANGNILPLVYKKYKLNNQSVAENLEYKKTIYDNLKCDGFNVDVVRNLDYAEKKLINVFSDYNVCKTGDNTVFLEKKIKGKFNVSAKGGLNFSQLDVNFDSGIIISDIQSATFENTVTFRLGLELEYILPFNNNKWSVFLEPTFISYSSVTNIEIVRLTSTTRDVVTIDYQTIEIPIGLRHYMFLNDTSKLFVNAAFVVSNDLSDFIDYENAPDIDIKSGTSGLFGLGYNYDNRFSIEGRLYFPRDVTSTYPFFNSPLSMTSIILGYQFL